MIVEEGDTPDERKKKSRPPPNPRHQCVWTDMRRTALPIPYVDDSCGADGGVDGNTCQDKHDRGRPTYIKHAGVHGYLVVAQVPEVSVERAR